MRLAASAPAAALRSRPARAGLGPASSIDNTAGLHPAGRPFPPLRVRGVGLLAVLRRCVAASSFVHGGSAMASLPSFSSVVWSAFSTGGCQFVSWRVSSRAVSGRVATVWFASPIVAGTFATAWAGRLGRSVLVRRVAPGAPCRPAWVVSVPIALWSPSPHHGQVLVAGGGGVRGVAASLRALGFVPAAA